MIAIQGRARETLGRRQLRMQSNTGSAPIRRGAISIAASAGVAMSFAVLAPVSVSTAAVLLDNTNNGAATLDTGSFLGIIANVEEGVQFTVAGGYTASLTTLKIGIGHSGSPSASFTAKLWSWSGSAATLITSDSFTAGGSAIAYYDFSFSDPGFSGLSAGSYLLTLSSGNMRWYDLAPPASPTSPTTGLSFDQYRRSQNSGSTWSTPSNQSSIQVGGTVTATGVPGAGLAVLGSIGLADLARRRRR
jgi:hypothetical protein